MPSIGNATYVKKNEGKALWVLGSLFEVKASGSDTGGAMAIVEMTFAPGQPGSPPHRHDCSEAVYVLEGTVRYHIGESSVDARAGDLLFFPKGTLEWIENPSDKPSKALVIYDRPGIADFFAEVGVAAATRSLPPPLSSPPDVAKLAAAGKRHGLEILPPASRQ